VPLDEAEKVGAVLMGNPTLPVRGLT